MLLLTHIYCTVEPGAKMRKATFRSSSAKRRAYQLRWRRENVSRLKAYVAARAKENPRWLRETALWTRFRLRPEAYAALLAAQGGRCAGCRKSEVMTRNGRVRDLCVDHDHACCPGPKSCGQCVRWLLCGSCNSILGYAQDDEAVLRRLADLLEGRRMSKAVSNS